MQFSCYIEINLICILLLGMIYSRLYRQRAMASVPQQIMMKMIPAVGVLCLSDIVAMMTRGRFFAGAGAVIEISNLVYLVMMPLISMTWCDYVFSKVGKKLSKKHSMLMRIPFMVFVLVAAVNPFTHFLFTINSEHLYTRGPGVALHWLISWFYLMYAGIVSYNAMRSTKSWALRKEYRPLLYFLILPAIGCMCQMAFYGVTSVQAGITLSLVLISMQMQDNQISTDELTGINNRAAMRHYVENTFHGNDVQLTVMMMDVNKFKSINDTYGHAEGDIALRDTAEILRHVCHSYSKPLFLCRYGGDEFIIIGREVPENASQVLTEMIRQGLAEQTSNNRPFQLSLSIGACTRSCASFADFMECVKQADDAMYVQKHGAHKTMSA